MKRIDPLSQLAIQHGTDKFGLHRYTPFYWRYLQDLREKPIRLLEIGIGGYKDTKAGGESLAMWRDFFKQGTIVGLDIFKKELGLGERVHVLKGSQDNAALLTEIHEEFGPFDIIIDDGSHINGHVMFSFDHLFPLLAQNGFYIVEDTQTSFFEAYGGRYDSTAPTMLNYFSQIFIDMDHKELADQNIQAQYAKFTNEILGVYRHQNLVVIEKGENTYPSNLSFSLQHPDVKLAFAAIKKAADNGNIDAEKNVLLMMMRAKEYKALEKRLTFDQAQKFNEDDLLIFLAHHVLEVKDPELGELILTPYKDVSLSEENAAVLCRSALASRCGELAEFFAKAALKTASDDSPVYWPMRTGFAMALHLQGKQKQAEAKITKVIEAEPDYAPAYLDAANLLWQSISWETRHDYLRKALDLDPKFEHARVRLAQLLQEHPDL